MVEKKWFDTIELIYLPVGHTHEKCDGILFGPIGRLKKTHQIYTPEDFPKFASKAFQRLPPVLTSDIFVWDWKAWMSSQLRQLKNFKKIRCFRFQLDMNGYPEMFYKTNVRNSLWLGYEGRLTQGSKPAKIFKNIYFRYSNFQRYPTRIS